MLVSRNQPKSKSRVDISSPAVPPPVSNRVIQPVIDDAQPVAAPAQVSLPGDSVESVVENEVEKGVERVDGADTDIEVGDDGPETPISSEPSKQELTTLSDELSAVGSIARKMAEEAVEKVLATQAEARLFDVVDSNRIVLTLQPDDLTILRAQWTERNSSGLEKITFSEFLSLRLRSCRAHNAARAIYVRDIQRRTLEDLFGSVLMTDDDLVHAVDRHIRPVIEDPSNPDGILRLEPLDPMILELVPSWYPDKTITKAISDFLYEAGRIRAGLD